MQFGKRIGPLARRVAAMQIPVYAGNASFFLLLSVFPVVSLLLSLLPYTPLTLDHLLAFCEEFAPDWTLRALEFFVRTLYASSSAAIISASAVLTLWSASKGVLSLLYGLDAVAEVRETRGYVQRRLLCVLYTVGMLLALLLTLGLYVGGQALLRFLTGRGFFDSSRRGKRTCPTRRPSISRRLSIIPAIICTSAMPIPPLRPIRWRASKNRKATIPSF